MNPEAFSLFLRIYLNKYYDIMITMNILFFGTSLAEQKTLSEYLPGINTVFYGEKLSEENVDKAKNAEIISVFVDSEINREIIDALPGLKFIATRSTGFDHIDLKYTESKGIKVSNVPVYGSHTVAEFTFALILALSRKIYSAYNHLRDGADFSIRNLDGFDLEGKTLGVIGTGKIGKNVIKIAKGFEMDVLAHDLHPDMDFAKEMNFQYKSLSETVAGSDILTLHTFYNKESYHLISKENILLMKRGVYIINTARGELIDTDALIWGLKERIIAGAGLDVLEGERELKEETEVLASAKKAERVKDYKTLLEDRVLIDMPNVIVTPHVAFYSKEAEEKIIKTTAENVQAFINGSPVNLVKSN